MILHRHFDRINKCYNEKEHPFYILTNKGKVKCKQCDKLYANTQGAMRHINEKHK